MRLEYSRGPIWLWLAAALLLAPGGVGMSAASGALGDEDDPTVGASAAAPAAETPGEDAVDDSNVPSEETPPAQPAADSDEPAADDVVPPNEQPADETQADPDDADAPAEMPAEGDSDVPAPLEPADAAREEPKFPSATLDADSLKRVRPHHTTRDQLHIEWGPPRGIERIAGGVRETYEETAFDRVRVTIINDKVESLAIQLETPLALEALAKPLEIEGLDPVDVFDEQGQLLGGVPRARRAVRLRARPGSSAGVSSRGRGDRCAAVFGTGRGSLAFPLHRLHERFEVRGLSRRLTAAGSTGCMPS